MLSFKSLFQVLGLTVESKEITSWLENNVNDPGVQMLTDLICDFVSISCDGSEFHDQIDSDEETSHTRTESIHIKYLYCRMSFAVLFTIIAVLVGGESYTVDLNARGLLHVSIQVMY